MSRDRVWDVLLAAATIAAAAFGFANREFAPVWAVITAALALSLVLHSQRARLGTWLVSVGVRVGGALPKGSQVVALVEEPLPLPSIPPSNHDRQAAHAVRTLLRDSFDAARYDNEHGSDERRAAAEHAATSAVADVEDIDNADARRLVRAYRDRLFATAHGWKFKGGATDADMAALRQAYDNAVSALGALGRG